MLHRSLAVASLNFAAAMWMPATAILTRPKPSSRPLPLSLRAMGFAKAKNAPAAQIAVARAMVVGAVAAAAFSWTEGRAQSPGASVVVVKAVKGCFVSAVRFTGLVVPR